MGARQPIFPLCFSKTQKCPQGFELQNINKEGKSNPSVVVLLPRLKFLCSFSVVVFSSISLLPQTFQGTRDNFTQQIGFIWDQIKAPFILPLLRLAVYVCLTMSLMFSIKRVYMSVGGDRLREDFLQKTRKACACYKWKPICDDLELGNAAYPMVLVQIPMY